MFIREASRRKCNPWVLVIIYRHVTPKISEALAGVSD